MRRLLRSAGVLFLLCALPGVAIALPTGAAPGIDAVLLLDSSGSMKTNDPTLRRVSAAKLFISLLGENDRVAIVSFSDNGYPVIGLTPVRTSRDRARLLAAVDKVSSRGAYTNLYAAVARARELLQHTPSNGHARSIFLLTDGQMDTGDKQRDRQLTEQLRNELAAQLAKDNVALHTIAFTASSDVALLRELSDKTHGFSRLAQSDRDLHTLFLGFFEGLKRPDMLPIDGGNFRIDRAISEVTVVVVKPDAKTRVVLHDPVGRHYVAGRNAPGVRWLSNEHFEMVTVANPAAGAWKLLAQADLSRAYIVTDMKLDADVAGALHAGERSDVQAWLTREAKVLTQTEILANTRFTVDVLSPDGSMRSIPLADDGKSGDRTAADGIYGQHFEVTAPGTHELRITAINPTFERRIARTLTVLPVATSAPAASPAATVSKAEEKPVAATAPATPDATPQSPPAERKGKAKHRPAEEHAGQLVTAKHASGGEGSNLWLVVGVFVLINLVLAGGLVVMYLRMRRKNPRHALVQFLEPGLGKGDADQKAEAPEAAKS